MQDKYFYPLNTIRLENCAISRQSNNSLSPKINRGNNEYFTIIKGKSQILCFSDVSKFYCSLLDLATIPPLHVVASQVNTVQGFSLLSTWCFSFEDVEPSEFFGAWRTKCGNVSTWSHQCPQTAQGRSAETVGVSLSPQAEKQTSVTYCMIDRGSQKPMGLQKSDKFLLMTRMSLSNQHTGTVPGADGDSAPKMSLTCSPNCAFSSISSPATS